MADDDAPTDDVLEDDASDETAADADLEDEAPAYSTPRLEAIRAPVPGDAPAGIDMKYEDEFQELKDQIDAMGAATGDVSFDEIVNLATSILSDKSKDLTVASYLILGLTRTSGYAGVAEGLASVRAVVEGFWEDAFPPLRRIRGRQSALQFVAERTSDWVKQNKSVLEDRDAIEVAQAEVAALQAFVTETMGEDAPAFSGLNRELRERLRLTPKPAAPEPEPEPEPEPKADAPAAAAAPAAPQAPASTPAPASGGGGSSTYTTVSEAQSAIFQIAGFLRSQDPNSATAVSLQRAARWDAIPQAPPTGAIPDPPEDVRQIYAGMVSSGNHAVLIKEGEGAFARPPFHFWLDLQRLLATSYKAMGPPGAAALSALEAATAALVRRLPALPTLTFLYGTPFADPLTIAWLDEIASSEEGGGGGGGSGLSPATEEAIQEAREKASGGDVPGAVAMLMTDAGAPRDRFERTVTAAELCLSAGRHDVALGLIEDADEAIQKHRLDIWDPTTAARALRILHTSSAARIGSATSPAQVEALSARANEAFSRLTRIDPAHAMRSTKPPAK